MKKRSKDDPIKKLMTRKEKGKKRPPYERGRAPKLGEDILDKLDLYTTEAYSGSRKTKFYNYKGTKKGDKKAAWMSATLDMVKQTIPDIEAPTPQGFWDTATYFFNQGLTSQDAAKKLKKSFKK